MGAFFSKDFWSKDNWLGRGPGQSTFQPKIYDPGVPTGQNSLPELQLKMGLGRILSGQKAMLAGNPGISPGLAAQVSGRQAGQAMTTTNDQLTMLRAQEVADYNRMMAGETMGQNQLLMGQDLQNQQAKARKGILGDLLSAGGQGLGYYLAGPGAARGPGGGGGQIGSQGTGYGSMDYNDIYGF